MVFGGTPPTVGGAGGVLFDGGVGELATEDVWPTILSAELTLLAGSTGGNGGLKITDGSECCGEMGGAENGLKETELLCFTAGGRGIDTGAFSETGGFGLMGAGSDGADG